MRTPPIAKSDASTVMQVVAVVLGWLSRVAELVRVSLHQTLTDVRLSNESPDPSRETKSTHMGGGVWYESVIEIYHA